MCVSNHMDLQNRVGRLGFYFLQYFCIVPQVRFLFKNKKIVHFRIDFRPILSSKPHNFSQSGPIYIFSIRSSIKKNFESHNKKTSVGWWKKGESVRWSETHFFWPELWKWFELYLMVFEKRILHNIDFDEICSLSNIYFKFNSLKKLWLLRLWRLKRFQLQNIFKLFI